MKKLKKQLSLALSTTMLFQALSSSAFAGGLQCSIVHDELRLNALQTLSQDQRTSLNTTLWQRLLNGKALGEFSVEKYKQSLGQLLAAEKSMTDQELWQSVEGKLAMIEFLNITSANSLKLDDMLTRLENLQAFSQRELMKMIGNRLESNSYLSAQYLDQWSQDFFLLLRGANVKTLDYMTMKAEARAEKQLGGLMQEELLAYGLKGALVRMGIPEATVKDRLITVVQKILHTGSVVTNLMTLRLPARRPVQMSEQLMSKVLLDGADAHKAEIEAELAPQIGKNRYEVVRKWLGPVMAVASVFYFYTGDVKITQTADHVTTQVVETKHQQDRAQVSAALQSISISLDQTSLMLDQLRYENTLRYIQQKWGRSPNASQMKDLLSQVYGQQLSSEQIQQIVGEVYQGQADVTHQDALQSIPERIQQLILNQNKKG